MDRLREVAPNCVNSRQVVELLRIVQSEPFPGAKLRRMEGQTENRNLDPFILFDEFKFTPPVGMIDHPHRGFISVSYMLSGKLKHEDCLGSKNIVETGDFQWFTTGRGANHCEMPVDEHRIHGLNLWINLSATDKKMTPSYQSLTHTEIPTSSRNGVTVKVLVGESYDGIKSPINAETPTVFLDICLEPGASVRQPVHDSWTCFVYILKGTVTIDGIESSCEHSFIMDTNGDFVHMKNPSTKLCRIVLIAGQPLGTPTVNLCGFVMNNRDEIQQSRVDAYEGKNGLDMTPVWQSTFMKQRRRKDRVPHHTQT